MRHTILILFILLCNTLSKGQDEKPFLWKDLQISFEGPDNSLIVFRRNTSCKVIYSIDQYGVSYFSRIGIYRSVFGDFLYNDYGTTGESGGSIGLSLYDQIESKIEMIAGIGVSGYGQITIVDMDGDKKEEIMTYCEDFYGKWDVDPLYFSGFGEILFPQYCVLDKNTDGEYYFRNVTFEKKYRNALKPYFIAAEKTMATKKINDGPSSNDLEIAGILQYYFYKTTIGEENDALTKIQRFNITIKLRDISKEGSFILKPMYQFIKENRAKIIN